MGKISTDSTYTASGEFFILVNDLDEPPTGIVLTPTSYNINENYNFGGSSLQVASFEIQDPDSVDNISLVVTGTDKDYFNVTYNSALNSGALFLVETGLDYETKNNITGIVAASNQTPFSLQTSGVFVVSVNDVNDPPIISISPTSIVVAEQFFTSSSAIATITITDEDTDSSFNTDNTLTITGFSNHTGIFELVGNTGLAIKSGTLLDFEDESLYLLDIIASNSAGNSSTGNFTLNVSNVAEPPTGISLTPTSVNINENYNFAGSHYLLSNVLVLDSDVNSPDNIVYVTGSDADHFVLSVDSSVGTGILYLNSGTSLNYENKNTYTGIVVAKQTGTDISVSGYFYLNVNDLGECPSINLSSSSESIIESQSFASNYKVADIEIVDEDAVSNNNTYITGLSTDTGIFTIITTGLYIKAGTTLDYETKDQYPIQVVVSDTGLSCSDTGNFTLDVVNVPDTAADIIFGCPRIYVPQNATGIDIFLGSINTTGGDDGATYNLSLSGAQTTDFTLDSHNKLFWNSGNNFGISGDTNSIHIVSSGVGGTASGISSELFTFNVVEDMPTFLTGVIDGVLSEWNHQRRRVECWSLTGQQAFVITNEEEIFDGFTGDSEIILYNTTNNTTSDLRYSTSYRHRYQAVASDKLFTTVIDTSSFSSQTWLAVYDFNTSSWSQLNNSIVRGSTTYLVDYLSVLDEDHLLLMQHSGKYLNLYKISTGQSYEVDTTDISTSYIDPFVFQGSTIKIEDNVFLFFPKGFSLFSGMSSQRQYPWRLDISNPGTSLELLSGNVSITNINFVGSSRSSIEFDTSTPHAKVGDNVVLVDSNSSDLHVYNIINSGVTHYSSGTYGNGPTVALSDCESFIPASGFFVYDAVTSGITQVVENVFNSSLRSEDEWHSIVNKSTGVHDYFVALSPYAKSGVLYNHLTQSIDYQFNPPLNDSHFIHYYENRFYFIPKNHNASASNDYIIVLSPNALPTDININPTSVSIAENTDTNGGYLLGHITLTDDGVGSNIIEISGSASETGIFELINVTGLQIKDGTLLDYEIKSRYDIEIIGYDTEYRHLPTTTPFSLHITDVNEDPTVSLNPISTSLVENTNTTNRIFLSEITINDDALGSNVLSLVGSDSTNFEIVNNTGLYLKSGVILDYDTKINYSFSIQVEDSTIPTSHQAGFELLVTEGNDAPVGLTFNPATGLIDEQVLSSNIKVADITIIDDGKTGSNNELFISGIPDSSSFLISGTELYLVSGLAINYEIKNIYTGFIGVQDTGVFGSFPVVELFTVEIQDVDEDPTGLVLSPISATIVAGTDTSTGLFLSDITIQDQDTDLSFQSNDIIASSIFDSFFPGSPTGVFSINDNSGLTAKLSIASGIDTWTLYDLNNIITGVIYYSDGTSTSLHTNFELTINSGNRPPSGLILESGLVSVPENISTSAGVLISYFSYVDDSHPDNNVDIYVTGTDSSAFVVDDSGIYITGVSLDYETKATYAASITIEDTGVFPLLTSTSGFVVNIADVDECPTDLTLSPSSGTVSELADTTSGIYLAEIVVTDDALGTNYLSLTGIDATGFQIVNGNDLIIKSGQPISSGTMLVDIVASGSGCPSDFSETFTLNIVAENTGPSAINISPSTISLNEHVYNDNGIDLATYTISDDNHPDGVNFVSLVDDTHFVLDTGLRKISLRAGVVLDYETTTSYTGYVTAVDLTTTDPAVTGMFVLNVLQWNEAPTGLSFSPTTGSLDENIDTSTDSVYVATITVLDDGHVASNNELSLVGATDPSLDANAFEISGMDIRLKQGRTLDHETRSFYNLTVKVEDTGVYFSIPFAASYTVNINDINECPTGIVFLPDSGTVLIRNYDISGTTLVSNVTLQDEDSSASGDFRLTGTDASMFILSGINDYQQGLYLNSGLTLSTGDYSVDVVIDDNSLACLDITGSFDLTVSDIDLPPTSITVNFVSPVYEQFGNYYIDEMTDVTSGVKIADIIVGDPDADLNIVTVDGETASGLVVQGRELYISGEYIEENIQPYGHTPTWLRDELKNRFNIQLEASNGSLPDFSDFPSATNSMPATGTAGYHNMSTSGFATSVFPGVHNTTQSYYDDWVTYEESGSVNAMIFRAGDIFRLTDAGSYYKKFAIYVSQSHIGTDANRMYYLSNGIDRAGIYVQNGRLYFRHGSTSTDLGVIAGSQDYADKIFVLGFHNGFPSLDIYTDDSFTNLELHFLSPSQFFPAQTAKTFASFRFVSDHQHVSHQNVSDCVIANDITLTTLDSTKAFANKILQIADIGHPEQPHMYNLNWERPTNQYVWENIAITGDVSFLKFYDGTSSRRASLNAIPTLEYIDYDSVSGFNQYFSNGGIKTSGMEIIIESGSKTSFFSSSKVLTPSFRDVEYTGWYNTQTNYTYVYHTSYALESGLLPPATSINVDETDAVTTTLTWFNSNSSSSPQISFDFSNFPGIIVTTGTINYTSATVTITGFDYEQNTQVTGIFTVEDPTTDDSSLKVLTTNIIFNIQDVDEPAEHMLLNPSGITIAENTNLSQSLKMSDISFGPDQLGSYVVYYLSDTSRFEISGDNTNTPFLYLKAGADINYESNAQHILQLNAVENPYTNGDPIFTGFFTLDITDVDESPVVITDTSSSSRFDEFQIITTDRYLADISIIDEDHDTVSLHVTGDYADRFKIIASSFDSIPGSSIIMGSLYLSSGQQIPSYDDITSFTGLIVATDIADNTGTGNFTINIQDTANCTPAYSGRFSSPSCVGNSDGAFTFNVEYTGSVDDVAFCNSTQPVTIEWDNLSVGSVANQNGLVVSQLEAGIYSGTLYAGNTPIDTVFANLTATQALGITDIVVNNNRCETSGSLFVAWSGGTYPVILSYSSNNYTTTGDETSHSFGVFADTSGDVSVTDSLGCQIVSENIQFAFPQASTQFVLESQSPPYLHNGYLQNFSFNVVNGMGPYEILVYEASGDKKGDLIETIDRYDTSVIDHEEQIRGLAADSSGNLYVELSTSNASRYYYDIGHKLYAGSYIFEFINTDGCSFDSPALVAQNTDALTVDLDFNHSTPLDMSFASETSALLDTLFIPYNMIVNDAELLSYISSIHEKSNINISVGKTHYQRKSLVGSIDCGTHSLLNIKFLGIDSNDWYYTLPFYQGFDLEDTEEIDIINEEKYLVISDTKKIKIINKLDNNTNTIKMLKGSVLTTTTNTNQFVVDKDFALYSLTTEGTFEALTEAIQISDTKTLINKYAVGDIFNISFLEHESISQDIRSDQIANVNFDCQTQQRAILNYRDFLIKYNNFSSNELYVKAENLFLHNGSFIINLNGGYIEESTTLATYNISFHYYSPKHKTVNPVKINNLNATDGSLNNLPPGTYIIKTQDLQGNKPMVVNGLSYSVFYSDMIDYIINTLHTTAEHINFNYGDIIIELKNLSEIPVDKIKESIPGITDPEFEEPETPVLDQVSTSDVYLSQNDTYTNGLIIQTVPVKVKIEVKGPYGYYQIFEDRTRLLKLPPGVYYIQGLKEDLDSKFLKQKKKVVNMQQTTELLVALEFETYKDLPIVEEE